MLKHYCLFIQKTTTMNSNKRKYKDEKTKEYFKNDPDRNIVHWDENDGHDLHHEQLFRTDE